MIVGSRTLEENNCLSLNLAVGKSSRGVFLQITQAGNPCFHRPRRVAPSLVKAGTPSTSMSRLVTEASTAVKAKRHESFHVL